MISDVKVRVDQLAPTVLSEGNMENPRMSNIGQLYTADWKMRYILAGRAYRLSIGTIAAGTAHVPVGEGTVLNLDRPLGIVAVDSGYLVPMSLQGGFIADTDNARDIINVLLTADRALAMTAAEIAAGTCTAETPDNLLDGGDAFVGRCASVATADVADPTHNDILYFNNWDIPKSDPLGPTDFFVDYEFEFPQYIAGGCTLNLYFAGIVAVTGMCSLVFAHIPASWVPTPS